MNEHDDEPGRYAVRRQGGDWHEVTLAVSNGEFVGRCDCDGFPWHDGPCSHLCAVYRLYASEESHDHWHRVEPVGYEVELRSDEEERAQTQAEPDHRPTAADGGRRL